MKLIARTYIKYGATKDERGNDRVPELATPGDTFEVSGEIAKQLLESGAAEPVKAPAKDKD